MGEKRVKAVGIQSLRDCEADEPSALPGAAAALLPPKRFPGFYKCTSAPHPYNPTTNNLSALPRLDPVLFDAGLSGSDDDEAP